MLIGERLRRFFAPLPKPEDEPKPGEKSEEKPAPTLSPDGEDVAALKKGVEQKPLLDSVAYQLSPYATAMMDYAGVRYNPDDLLSRKGFDIYQRMMLDEQVKAVVRFKQSAILARGWELYYPDDCELSEEERAERIRIFEAGLRNMGGSFKTGLKTILRSMWQGFSVTEKSHTRFEYKGKTWIGLKALMARPFDTIHFKTDPHGHIEKCIQRVPGQKEVEVPLNRVVYMVHNADIDPHYGQSDLREAYRAYFTKDMAIRFGNIHMERMAGGMVFLEPDVGTNIPPNSQEWLALQTLLKNMSAATGALLPKGVKANVVHPSTTDVFKLAIESANLAIAKALLVPNLLGVTETGQTGAYAQSQTQFEAFLWTLDDIGSSTEEVVTEQVFAELGRANFADGLAPCFRFKPMSDSQRDMLLKSWSDLIQKGAVEASDTDEKHVRKLMDFPEKGEPIKKPVAIDPETGLPMPEAGPDGKPKVGPDGKPVAPKPGQPPGKPAPMEETIAGRSVRVHSHRRAHMTVGEKRFQFEVARRRTEGIEAASRAALRSAIKEGVSGMVGALRSMGKEALALEALEFSKGATSAVKRALRDGMAEAAGLGLKLAAGEVQSAQRQPQRPASPNVLEIRVVAPAANAKE